MSEPASTMRALMGRPSGPVWWVCRRLPNIPSAAARTSSLERHSFTPPALPRPPACTWAFTTHRLPPRDWAAAVASAALRAGIPRGTGMPYSANSCFAWYSCRFMLAQELLGWLGEQYFEAKHPNTQRRGLNDEHRR